MYFNDTSWVSENESIIALFLFMIQLQMQYFLKAQFNYTNYLYADLLLSIGSTGSSSHVYVHYHLQKCVTYPTAVHQQPGQGSACLLTQHYITTAVHQQEQ